MSVFAACLFALAGLASAWALATSLRRHGAHAIALRAQLRDCPEMMMSCWNVVERAPSPALALLRKDPGAYPAHRPPTTQDRPELDWALDWPALEHAA